MDQGRATKLADRIAQIVAEMLERRVKDPRLGFVTVTDAKITGDLREATVYYTVYGSAEERGEHRRGAEERHRADPLRGRAPDRAAAHPVAVVRPDTLPDGARSTWRTWSPGHVPRTRPWPGQGGRPARR